MIKETRMKENIWLQPC